MNKKVRNIDPESLLFIDIETVRRNKEIELDTLEYDVFSWTLRNKETSELPPFEEVSKAYKLKGGLSPATNKIVCISVGYIKGTTFYYKGLKGSQKEILKEAYTMLKTSGKKPCLHNGIGFDIPVMRLKALEENIDFNLIPESIMDSQQKPWLLTDNIIDTMDIAKGTFYYPLSLQALCLLTGVETPKDDISGADVSRVYYEEENGINRIVDYCNKDIIATAKAFLALQGKRDYLTEFVDKSSSNEAVEKLPVLERLRNLGEITDEVEEEIKELLSKKKVLKKDIKYIDKILKAALFREDFINSDQDKKDVRQQKEEDIKRFIESL